MNARKFLDIKRESFPTLRVKVNRDALPNGLAVAMAPAVTDWERSSVGHGDDDFYLVRGVNFGGNPVQGRSILATVKVPCHGVVAAEWVMTLMRIKGRDTPGGHGQLRLIFAEDRRPMVLNREGQPFSDQPYLDDLVFSFEAWRPPAAQFDALAGLDPRTYALTMRCYSGGQRFLEDSLKNMSWTCYPLRVPDTPNAHDELLYTCLAMGDSLARLTLEEALEDPGNYYRGNPADYEPLSDEEKSELQELLERMVIPDQKIAAIFSGDRTYHLLLRSCITMALAAVDACFSRIHHLNPELGEYRNLQIAPVQLPSWLDRLAHMGKRNTLKRIPGALHWMMNNQNVIPGRAHQILDAGELLQRDDKGNLIKHHYHIGGQTPYGPLSENLMQ